MYLLKYGRTHFIISYSLMSLSTLNFHIVYVIKKSISVTIHKLRFQKTKIIAVLWAGLHNDRFHLTLRFEGCQNRLSWYLRFCFMRKYISKCFSWQMGIIFLNIQSCHETKKSVNSKTKVQKFYSKIPTKMHFFEY